jgi:hypothetical protein
MTDPLRRSDSRADRSRDILCNLLLVATMLAAAIFGAAWLDAVVTAALLSLEPVVHYEVGRPVLSTTVVSR